MSTKDRIAWSPVVVLTLINAFNYIDRFVFPPVLGSVRAEFGLTNAQAGMLGSAFIASYAFTSPLFGWLGDRGRRLVWIALGVGLWSLATGLGGLAVSFVTLLLARATVGIGEAAYGTLTPALLSDYVPKARRGFIMAVFFMGMPVGSALGYVLGGNLGEAFGWRTAFFAVGFPGLLLALSVLFLREPTRGGLDAPEERGVIPLRATLRELWRSRVYVWTVFGYTAYTFAIGGLAIWMPDYLVRVRGFGQGEAGTLFGGMTVFAGAVGTLVGGAIGDRLQRRSPNGYVILSVVAMVTGSTLALLALLSAERWVFLTLLMLSEILIFANTGPINALIVNSVPPGLRARASGVCILTIHFGGDLLSPTFIGLMADHVGLATAMLTVPVVFLFAGVLWAGSWTRRA